MNLEPLWYESSPFVYLVLGLAAVLFSHSALGLAFSAVLIATAITIFSLRLAYRSPASEMRRKYARPVR